MPRIRDSRKLVGPREPVTCLFCQKRTSEAQNLKKHLKRRHFDFIILRMKTESITVDQALKLTINNHIFKDSPIPEALFKQIQSEKVGDIWLQSGSSQLIASNAFKR